ncbi:MAG: hypothetical protein M3Z25_01665 [Actinomycetota bacterium]|nr:hypothetical protein [Actinomycetota bacterium]
MSGPECSNWPLRLARLDTAILAAVTLAIVLVAGCTAGPQVAAGAPQRIELTYVDGAVRGGVSRVPVGLGRHVRLVVTSDVADEVHVHGYDLKADVPAHGAAMVDFVADRSGVFEVELESRGAQLAQLEVR